MLDGLDWQGDVDRNGNLCRTRVLASADIAPGVRIGEGSSIWHLAQIRESTSIGRGCVIGRGVYIGVGIAIGDYVKIQNYALVYEPAVIEDGAFIGPSTVLTNDRYPRSVNPDGSLKNTQHWERAGVTVREGASIGARVVCVAPVEIGRWAVVAAGSVVTRDVRDYALAAGIPARQIGWVGRAGRRLVQAARDRWVCPATMQKYYANGDELIEG